MSSDIQKIESHVLKKYQVLKKLGSGAYGQVWKVKNMKDQKIYALKKIFDAFQHATDAQRTYRQIIVLQQLEHPNIIKLIEIMRAENNRDIYLIFEYMESDLHNVICQGILQEVHKRYIIYQILKSLKYLHSADLVHRDLKPSNILLNSDCLTKICDFGLIRSVAKDDEEMVILTQGVATRWYRAPEVLLGSKQYNQQADMWSVGCIIAQIILRKPLFPGNSTFNQLQRILALTGRPNQLDLLSLKSDLAKNMIEQMKQIKIKDRRELFGLGNQQVVDLIYKLLHFNPKKRLTVTEALNHPYLSDFSNKKQQIECKKKIKFTVNDNIKLSIAEYKKMIYETIKEEQIQSPKKFSDLRKFSVKKQSKNNSNAYTPIKKVFPLHQHLQHQQQQQNSMIQPMKEATIVVNTSNSKIINKMIKNTSPNSFKNILEQQKQNKQNRQINGTFQSKLNDLLKPKNVIIKQTLSPKLKYMDYGKSPKQIKNFDQFKKLNE